MPTGDWRSATAPVGWRGRTPRRSSSTRCWSLPADAHRLARRLARRSFSEGGSLGVGGMLGRTRRVHFVGVGGIGMSGIAELLANLGYEVSGSDAKESEATARLRQRFNVRVVEGHAADNIGDA